MASSSACPWSLKPSLPPLPPTQFSSLKPKKSFRTKSLIQEAPKGSNPSKKSNSISETLSLVSQKNPHSLHNEIQRLASLNHLDEALSLTDCLQHLGIPVNPTTFSSLISACIRSKSPHQAKRIDSQIHSNGLRLNEFLRIKMIQLYASCGCFDDAELELFHLSSSSSSGVYQWNALLRGIVVSGNRRCDDVLSVYSKMRDLGVEMNEYSFSCLIKGLAGGREFKEGLKAHGLLIKNGLIGSSILITCLIDMYFKCRKPRLAHHLFDEMPDRDIVAWGAMIAGFAHSGLPREALECLRRMIQEEGIAPNSVSLTAILPVIGELGERNIGKEIHAYVMKKTKYFEQVFIQSALIDMYSKCGDINSARKTFNGSKKRNRVSWTALISGYISNGRLEQALRLLIWMQQEGLRPDAVTLATVIPVCAHLKAALQGRSIHGYLLRNGISLNVSLTTSLMVMYSKCDSLHYSRRLFDRMEPRNVISSTAMIDSFVDHGFLEEALDVFRSMLLRKHKPDAVAISKVLLVCSELQLLVLGKEIHGYLVKRNFLRLRFVADQLSSLYRNCTEVGKAQLVLDHNRGGSEGDQLFEDPTQTQLLQ